MLTLCIVTLIGYIARKREYFSEAFSKKFSTLVIDICAPSLIMSSVMGDTLPDRNNILPLLGVSFASYILLTGLAVVLPRLYVKDKADWGLFGFMIIFGNVGFIGYPVCAALFGNEAVFYASVLNFPNTLFVFTVGVALIKQGMETNLHKGDFRLRDESSPSCVNSEGEVEYIEASSRKETRFDWSVLWCPGCIAAYVSMLIVALGITNIPQFISRPLTLVGNITVPASLLIIGASMAEMPIKQMLGSTEVYITALLRVAIVPLMVFAVFTFMPVSPMVRNVNMVVLGMPVASFGTMLCLRYGRDPKKMTETTFVTTVASLISIPLLSLLF